MDKLEIIRRNIAQADSKIFTLGSDLSIKQEMINRLKEAQAKLIDVKNDFFGEIDICLEPEFSLKTFHGNNSDNYDAYRRIDLKGSFKEVSNTQTMNAIAKMQEKINQLSEEENDIKQKVSSLQHTRRSLNNKYNTQKRYQV